MEEETCTGVETGTEGEIGMAETGMEGLAFIAEAA
jgi:hypothetical protein